MYYEDLLLEAVDTATEWSVPADCFAQVVAERLEMAPESGAYFDFPVDDPYEPLAF